jgi:hypothetical protein
VTKVTAAVLGVRIPGRAGGAGPPVRGAGRASTEGITGDWTRATESGEGGEHHE